MRHSTMSYIQTLTRAAKLAQKRTVTVSPPHSYVPGTTRHNHPTHQMMEESVTAATQCTTWMRRGTNDKPQSSTWRRIIQSSSFSLASMHSALLETAVCRSSLTWTEGLTRPCRDTKCLNANKHTDQSMRMTKRLGSVRWHSSCSSTKVSWRRS
jgi:hypothetical protein